MYFFEGWGGDRINYVFLLSRVSTSFIRPIVSYVAFSFLFSTFELRLYNYCLISILDINYAFPAIEE
jgi:hypothetical protein